MKFAVASCVVLAAAAGASAQTFLYNSNGFEAPGFTVGALAGQQGFISDNPAASAAGNVQNTFANGGSQAVRLDGGIGTNWFYPALNYTPNAGEIISVRADIARTLGANTSSFGFLLDIYGNNGARIARAGLGTSGGAVRALVTTLNTAGAAANFLANSTVYGQNQWVNFDIQLNFTTRTFDLIIDGVTAGTNLPMTNNAATGLADADLQVSTAAGATDAGFFDNYSVSVIPTPSSAALLGLGGLAALRRRRK